MEHEGSLPHSHVPATALIMSLINPVTVPFHFLVVHLNIIHSSTPWSSKWSLSLSFPYQNHLHTSPLDIRAKSTTHFVRLDLFTRIILSWEYELLSSSLCSFFYSLVTSSSLLIKNKSVRIHKNKMLLVSLYGCGTWSLKLREERRLWLL
jgi:hypothetical protein